MKVKKTILGISDKDIIEFFKLQNKIEIVDVEINNNINIIGKFELLKMGINFQLELLFNKVENNSIYINISNLKMLKVNILNSISKKSFNYIINAFTNIEGISFEGDYFKVDISKLIGKYYEENNIVQLDSLEVIDIYLSNNEIELVLESININPEKIIKEEIIEEPILVKESIDDIKEDLLTIDELKKYDKEFDEKSFFEKIKDYSKTAGISVIYAALILYYTYKDKNVPLKAKAISLGALGYFILPTDIIPDFILVSGFSDDCFSLIMAIKSISIYINDDIKLKARNRLEEWFENIDDKELQTINAIV